VQVEFSLSIGILLICIYILFIYLSQKKSSKINISWFFLIPIIAYGYFPAFVFKFYGIETTLSSINGLSWVLSEYDISYIINIFNSILLGLIFLESFLFFSPKKYNVDYHFSLRQDEIKNLYLIVLILTFISFFIRYGGINGYIEFISYSLRRDAYNELDIGGGGILSRYDLLSLMLFSVSLYYFYEKINYRYLALSIGFFSIFIIVISGSRLPIFCSLFIWLYISRFYLDNYNRVIIKTILYILLLIPFSTFWGVARNSGWGELEYSSYNSILKIIPSELYSVYFSTSSYIPQGNTSSFISMFFPEKILNIFDIQKYSLSEDVNTYLKGPYAAAVYIAPISIWIVYPLGNSIMAVLLLTVIIFGLYRALVSFSEKFKFYICISPVLIASILFVVRLDPGAWFSRILQIFILYFLIQLLVRIFNKLKFKLF
jgi:hypothetical protein